LSAQPDEIKIYKDLIKNIYSGPTKDDSEYETIHTCILASSHVDPIPFPRTCPSIST
jgi:hypothetical protein